MPAIGRVDKCWEVEKIFVRKGEGSKTNEMNEGGDCWRGRGKTLKGMTGGELIGC